MSSDPTIREVLAGLTIAAYALLTSVAGIAHGDGRTNIFPNPNVRYQIPLGESPKQQARYLFGVLKENNYSKLERQLRRYVPELKRIHKEDIEPLDDVVTLAVTATNPEVKEAFDLMIKGGRRRAYNTELQVLFWLAQQNEFKQNDTLAMAIAMVNGLYVSIGTKEVKEAVKKDVNDFLNHFRWINKWQTEEGYYPLEDYPLEAKIYLAWRGNITMKKGYTPFRKEGIPFDLPYYSRKKLPSLIYNKNNVSIETLKEMKGYMEDHGWMSRNPDEVISKVEESLFGRFPYPKYNWEFTLISFDEDNVIANINVNYQFKRLKEGKKPIGDCGTEMVLVDSLYKSIGGASIPHWMYTRIIERDLEQHSHSYAIYYDPYTESWKAYRGQVLYELPNYVSDSQPYDLFIFVPPINQKNYLHEKIIPRKRIGGRTYEGYEQFEGNMYHLIKEIPLGEIKRMFLQGVPTKEMKKWLLSR